MENRSKVSIIIPIYNSEKYLHDCLDSVLSQTLDDIEVICINDGSVDGSLDILKGYAEKDKRIVVLDKANEGVAVARNIGINKANGEFVCFMDSDDLYPTDDVLETLYSKAKENNVLVAGGEFSVFDENIKPYEFKQKFGKFIDGYLFKKDGLIDYKNYQFDYGFHRFIYNREMLIKNSIYFPEYTRLEDPIFFIKSMHQAKKFYAVNKISYGYRSRPKEVKFTEQNTVDTLNAILEMLDFADENNYKKLEKYVAKRYIEHLEFIKNRTDETRELETKIKERKSIKRLLNQERRKKFFQNIFSIKNEMVDGKKVKILRVVGIILNMKNKKEILKKKDNEINNKKIIKINFCDFYSGFEVKNNWFYNILSKNFNIEISDNPDFLFYSCFGWEYKKFNNCVKIFFTGECIVPNFNDCDYAIGFDDISFDNRYLTFNMFYNTVKSPNLSNEKLLNRKFCNFIYSNFDNGEGALLRQEFFKKLSEYKHIDAPGKVCNNMQTDELCPRFGGKGKSKAEFIEQYKFTIAFENSSSYGYTTEKFFEPIRANSIPIYYGNPDIVKDFNPKAFINCNDYSNDLDKVVERVIELDNDDEKYLAMLNEPIEKENCRYKNQHKNLEKFVNDIVLKGNRPFNKDPLGFQKYNEIDYINDFCLNSKPLTFAQKLFSIREEVNKRGSHKVITILGITMKFRGKLNG